MPRGANVSKGKKGFQKATSRPVEPRNLMATPSAGTSIDGFTEIGRSINPRDLSVALAAAQRLSRDDSNVVTLTPEQKAKASEMAEMFRKMRGHGYEDVSGIPCPCPACQPREDDDPVTLEAVRQFKERPFNSLGNGWWSNYD